VLRLQGSGLCDLKPDRCVASDQIDSYLEPDGRSGIMSLSPRLIVFARLEEVFYSNANSIATT
jgi:hypothetical protein